jgi:hypothetical protein
MSWIRNTDFRDVVFVFLDEEGNEIGQVSAHKMVLCLNSEYFRATLVYTEIASYDKGVSFQVVRDTSFTDFKDVIRYMYTGCWGETGSNRYDPTNLDLLFRVLLLADRYHLEELMTLVRSNIEMFPVSAKNYVTIFRNCDTYQHLPCTERLGLKQLCKDLRDRCALTLLKKWASKDRKSSKEYGISCYGLARARFWTRDYNDDQSLKLALLDRQGELADAVCSTCGRYKESCPIGERLTHKKCAVGMRVKAAWTEGSCDFLGSLDVPPGTVGIVKDYSGHIKKMSARDTDDESESDNEDAEPIWASVGFLSVKWSNRQGRSIYKRLDHFVIASCTDPDPY